MTNRTGRIMGTGMSPYLTSLQSLSCSRASDPKVDSTFGFHPMLPSLRSASFERKTGSTFC
jgi:hypothetical protein